mgnify:FL=1
MIGIGTTVTPGFEEWKDTLTKEPEGDVKKRYVVTCQKPSDWTKIHSLLLKDGTLEDNIPTDAVQCSDVKGHSPIRGTYILDAAEVADLLKCSEVSHIEIDQAAYPGTYMPDPLLLSDAVQQQERYSSTVKNIRGNASSYLPSTPLVADKDRAGFQLLRSQQKSNPWGSNVNQVLNNKPLYYGDGRDVDVVVADQAAWLGHIEFQNNLGGPQYYEPGNALTKRNISNTAGTCDVLDLVLDAPYYIDPDYFNADPAGRLTTRWDGTTVPIESVALGWWSDTAKRSAAFASVGTVDVANGGYTRDRSNGSNITYQTAGSSNYHGTPCASLVYGRNHGWAFNANKWYINAYGTYGVGVEKYFDITKIFHQNKPLNSTYGTKDPTITSNSFGYRKDLPNSAYHFFRKGTTGAITNNYSIDVTAAGSGAYTLSGNDSGGSISGNNITVTVNAGDTLNFVMNASGHPFWIKTQAGGGTGNQATGVTNGGTESGGTVTWTPTTPGTYYYQCEYHGAMVGTITVNSVVPAGTQYTSLTQVPFLNNFYQGAIRFEFVGNSMVTAGDEMIAAGVIFVCSSGNTNQKLVKSDHPDWNNYWSTGPDTPYDQATTIAWGYSSYNSINRQGFPGQIGKTNANVYRTIPVGAMDTDLQSTSGTGQERKIVYSNMGNLVPFYAPAYDLLSGCDNNSGTRYTRYDGYYTLNGQQSVLSEETRFGGTSAACPAACGLIATKLQYNRGWTVEDVLDWVTNQVGSLGNDFYTGTESTTYDDVQWSNQSNTQGGEPIIIWDAATGQETESGDEKIQLRFRNAGGIQISGVNFINT